MKRNARTAFNKLKKLGVPVYETSDTSHFGISAEDENSYLWLDYYGEFRGGYPFVHEDVEQILNENNLFAEWENPGCMTVYDN